jgi:hypothetical protein
MESKNIGVESLPGKPRYSSSRLSLERISMTNNEMSNEDITGDHQDKTTNDETEDVSDERVIRNQSRRIVWSKLLDGLQRLICLGLAAWHYIYTGDTWGSLIIIAAGFIDARIAKAIIIKFLNLKK